MGTAKVSYGSDLQRRNWLKDGLLAEASSSFWLPFTGNSSDAIVYQENDERCDTGHTVVFDYSGKLTGKAVRGDDVTYGKGEVKRKFSSKITVDEFNLIVDNGKKFDACDIDDLSLTQHGNSRAQLADLFIRWKDQMIFDAQQGGLGSNPTHVYDLGTTFTYNDLLYIEDAAKTGKNLKATDAQGAVSATDAGKRAPLSGFRTENGDKIYLAVIDSAMALKLKADPNYQTIVMTADVRGNNNRTINMVVGRLGKVIYVEAGDFFGSTEGEGTFGLHDSEIEYAGLRKYAVRASDGAVVWEGQVEFDRISDGTEPGDIYSRGLLLGAGAVQTAWGMMPNYVLEFSDFKKTSQSLMEFWCNAQKTVLTLEGGKDYKHKVAEIDYSVIALDMKHV